MLSSTKRRTPWLCLLLILGPTVASAQNPGCEDANIDAMRGRSDIGASDQRRIQEWVERQVANFAGWNAFRTCLQTQREHPNNSEPFRLQLATQTTEVAIRQFALPNLDEELARALAQVLFDMNRPETYRALIAALEVKHAAARYLCVRALAAQKRPIAADRARLDGTVQALLRAGRAETSPAVLGRIYEALGFTGQLASVFDAYIQLLDRRLVLRRQGAVVEDGAEIPAFEFFRQDAVAGSLTVDQRSQLVARVTVFLRLDAERYNTPVLTFDEIDRIERMLEAAEAVVAKLVGGAGTGGRIRDALAAGAHENRRAVLQEAYRWVGNPDTRTSGALNGAPWNVPPGAP